MERGVESQPTGSNTATPKPNPCFDYTGSQWRCMGGVGMNLVSGTWLLDSCMEVCALAVAGATLSSFPAGCDGLGNVRFCRYRFPLPI